MPKPIILTLFITFGLSGYSQDIQARLDLFRANEHIDTFLVYSQPCSGGLITDSCSIEDTHYLFWTKNNNFFLKRFDYCQTFKPLALDTSNPLAFYLKNRKQIDKEEILPPSRYEFKKHGNITDTLILSSFVDHSCYHTFALPFSKKPKYKSVDSYNLNFEKFENGRRNIYYTHNQKTKLKTLIDLTTVLINKCKTMGMFKPG